MLLRPMYLSNPDSTSAFLGLELEPANLVQLAIPRTRHTHVQTLLAIMMVLAISRLLVGLVVAQPLVWATSSEQTLSLIASLPACAVRPGSHLFFALHSRVSLIKYPSNPSIRV